MRNKQGIAPLVIVAVVAVVGIIAGGGYFLTRQKANTGAGGAGSQQKKSLLGGVTFNPNCKLNDPDLCKYMNRATSADFLKAGFSGKSVTVDAKGQKSESLWEMAGEGKSHFVTNRNGKEESNIIMIDGAMYMKDYTDNKWFKYPASQSNEGKSGFSVEEMKKNMKIDTKEIEDKTTYEKVGKEPCGSLTCVKYKVMTPFGNTTMVQYMFIDTKEYLLRKMRVENEEGGSTETEFMYNPVSIEIPSPVKEMNVDFGNMMKEIPAGEQGSASSIDTKNVQEELRKIMEQAGQEDAGMTESSE